MNYNGRAIDPVSLWERYVTFPAGIDPDDAFAPKVQCPNPNHDTLKRHFQVNLREPLVHCFAYCGISGSYEHAVCVIEGLYDKFKVDLEIVSQAWGEKPHDRTTEQREHLRRQQRAHREARRIILRGARPAVAARRSSSNSKARGSRRTTAAIPSDYLRYDSFLPPIALEYLEERGISERSISEWQLGWLPEEKRIAIPARDENGRLKFLIKRAVLPRQNPKYLYTEGFPKTSLLFGAGQIDLGMIRSHGLVLVEGSLDVVLNHSHGLKTTVGILGTGISERQVRIVSQLRPSRIYFMFDRDTAGVKNIEIASRSLRKYPLYVIRFPTGKNDPAELTKQEALRAYERAIPLREFVAKLRKLGIEFSPNVTRPKGAVEIG